MSDIEHRTTVFHQLPPGRGAWEERDPSLVLAKSTARVGFWSWDLATGSVWHSAEMYRLHGVTPGALGDRLEDYLAFIHPDDRVRVTEAAWAASTGDTLPLEYRFVHPDGGIRHLLGHSALVRDGSGTAQRLVGTVQDVSEVMRARRSVSDAFTRLSSYFEASPTPAYLWQREGDDLILRKVNEAAVTRWGSPEAAWRGMRASDLRASQPEVVADITRCLEDQVAFTRETDYRYEDGSTRRLVLTYVPVSADAVVAHAEDRSDLIAANERERRATTQLAEYFQRVPTPAYLWRASGEDVVLEAVNRAAEEATAGRVAGLIGMTAGELYADRPDIVDDLRRARAGETFTRECPYESRSTGEHQELVVTYVHIPPDAVAAHTHDVTEQRRTEEALRESRESARQLMEGNPDGICLIVDGSIRDCNASLSALLDCAREALVGRKLHDLMIPDDRERARERGKTILDGGPSEPSEYTLVRCDGSLVPVEIFGAAFDYRGQRALICALRDVAMRHAAEQDLADSRDALRALTQHLEHVRETERAQVARDLHDELGSVLTALKIDLGEAFSGAPGAVDPALAGGMSKLVDQAIEVGRRVTARLRPGILDDLGLAAAAEWLGADLQKRTGIRCRVVLPDEEPSLPEPVATAMFRTLQEALTNVIRHADAGVVEVALEADEESICLTVADDGKGFDPAAVGGAGFGLLGMRERVRAFEGTFDVASTPGEGTRIRVALPLENRGETGRRAKSSE